MEIIHENEYLYRMNKEAEPYLELHRQEKYTYSIIWQKIPGVSL